MPIFPWTGVPVARLDYGGAAFGSTALDDSGVLAGAWAGAQRKDPDDLMVVAAPALMESVTGRALRVKLNRRDNPIGYGDRAEVQVGRQFFEGEGGRGFYQQTIYIPADMPDSNLWSGWGLVSQHHATGPGSPPVGWYCEYGHLTLKLNRQSAPAQIIEQRRLWRMPIAEAQGRALHLAWAVTWSVHDSVGSVELWVNGEPQALAGARRHMSRTMVPGTSGTYRKMGCYCQEGTELVDPVVVYYANANSYAQVTIGAPPPPPPPPPPSVDGQAVMGRLVAAQSRVGAAEDALELARRELTAAYDLVKGA